MKWVAIGFLTCFSAGLIACGGGASQPAPGSLSGNWQFSLQRHAIPGPLTFSGFLLQSGSAISGSMILGGGCEGVGPVSGTLNDQDLALTIDEYGQNILLTGNLPQGGVSSSTFVGGAFSSVAGGCLDYASTGTWSAVKVAPLSGKFHGTLVGTSQNNTTDTFNVTGTISQGPNTGLSNATISGTLTATGAQHFCGYLTTATISGLISGTQVSLNLFDTTGSLITQISPASITADGTSLTCAQGVQSCFIFPSISSSCSGEPGTIQLSFP